MTQQEVADSLGMTRPMVGLVEQRAKAKIRKLLAEKNIKVSDLLEAM
jgi:transcriptional regulator